MSEVITRPAQYRAKPSLDYSSKTKEIRTVIFKGQELTLIITTCYVNAADDQAKAYYNFSLKMGKHWIGEAGDGYIFFDVKPKYYTLGYFIYEKYQSKGYGSFLIGEVLNFLEEQRVFEGVQISTPTENIASNRLILRNGFAPIYKDEEVSNFELSFGKPRFSKMRPKKSIIKRLLGGFLR